MNVALLTEDLKDDEGFRPHAYRDHLGFWTIGYGRLIDERKDGGISEKEALFLLDSDIYSKIADLDRELPWWRSLTEPRQRALCNMCFQLGINGLKGFQRALRALEAGDYEEAYKEFLDSKWARQTPNRAKRVAELFR